MHYSQRILMGKNFVPKTTIELEDSPLVKGTTAGGVYLDAGNSFLELTPWLAFGFGDYEEEELFVYKSKQKWETYHNSDRYPADKEKIIMEQLLAKHPPSTTSLKNKEEGKVIFEAFLADYVEDGVLDGRELRKLVDIQLKFGLVKSDEEGMQEILTFVESEYPDVVLESLED